MLWLITSLCLQILTTEAILPTDMYEFLYQSIEDSRSTIRAIDIKAGFLFVIIFQPLLHFSVITTKFTELCTGSTLWSLLVAVFTVCWGLSLFFLLRSVLSISNPVDQITGGTPNDIFYDGGLFRLNIWDAFFNRTGRARVSFEERVNQVREGEQTIYESLVFEKMKLGYIRDIKMKRINACIWCLLCWLFLGMGISIYCIILTSGGS